MAGLQHTLFPKVFSFYFSADLKVLMMIYFMLEDEPCPEEPLMPEIAYLLRTDKDQYEKNVREWTQKYAMGSSH